ncbi:MAG: carboxypeptidase regulatory-like domain-containing protein [Acidobacteria bacterium]|nr:carboxypeptidase regulatory-like domain-containing protein [Acidobacteriota bacterium]
MRTSHRSLQTRLLTALACVAVLIVPAVASAQTAEVRGLVIDSSGAVLPGVTVTIRHESTGVERTIVTDDQGAFRAPALQPGPYVIESELSSFGKDVHKIVLTVGQVADVRVTLSLGAVEESVQVVGTAAEVQIESTKSDLSGVVVQEQLAELPVLNRGFVGLAQLLPGGGPSRTQDGRFGISTAFGGTNVRSMYSMQIDGGIMDHPIYGFAIVNVSQDAVQEFRVLRNQFDAEFSRAGTAVVNVVTRSGTNDLHGQVSYFGRDDGLNAKNAFATTKPPFDSARVSGTLGGPIIRNKTFLFGALEYNRQNSVRIIALPAANPFAAEFNGVYDNGVRAKLGQAKIDHTASPTHSFTGRYLYDNDDIVEVYELAENTALDFNDVSANWNWTLGSATLNSVTVQYLDQDTQRLQLTPDTQVIRPSFTAGRSPNLPQGFPRKRYTVNDTFFWAPGRHATKFGVRMSYEDLSYNADYYGAGVWQFNTDRPFDRNDRTTWPTKFTIGSGPATKNYRNTEWGFFAQDDVRLGDVTLNLGLRYDFDTNLRSNDLIGALLANPQFAGLENLVTADRGNDLDNIQPRAGFAWDTRGDGRTVVRGGYGLYSGRNRPWFNIRGDVVSNQFTAEISDLNLLQFYPDQRAALGGRTLEDFISAAGGRALYLPGDDLSLPYVRSATIGVAKLLPGDTSLEVDFIHQEQKDLQTGRDANLPAQGPLTTNPRPYPQFSSVTLINSLTDSTYDALQAQLRRRYRSSTWQVSYTFAKAISEDTNDNASFNTDPWNTFGNDDRGLDENDRRHALSVSVIAPLPWQVQLATIVSLRSGNPWDITAGADLDRDGNNQDRPPGLVKNAGGTESEGNLAIVNAFRASQGRTPITMEQLTRTSRDKVVDLRATKQFQLAPRARLDVFLEAYNLLNTVNYENPSGVATSGSFATYVTARDARQIQWGARIQF